LNRLRLLDVSSPRAVSADGQVIVDPRQNRLFDVYDEILSDTGKRRPQSSWHFLFCQTLLHLLPAGEHFDPEIGRPTKDLYSMAGLLLIKEFKNWLFRRICG